MPGKKLKQVDQVSTDTGYKKWTFKTKSVILAAVVIIIIAFAVNVVWNSADDTSLWYKIRNVTRSRMSPKLSYRTVAESREPVILTNTIIEKWPARRVFRTKFFAAKLHQVSVHHQEKNRHFITFHDNKPLEPLVLNESWEDYNVKINISISSLLGWTNDSLSPYKGPWNYYSQDMQQLKKVFPEVIGYVQPIDELILSEDNVQVNLWIGRAGIITHTHYDATYNFFVQLQGRKRFTLFPPNQTMYLYPCLHPHYGHSQVNILNVKLEEYPLFKDSQAVVAEVGPGDMLVVPPYWFHHVETLEESVSVNIWSDAPEYALMNEIYGKPIPFEEEWDWSNLVVATKIYSEIILNGLDISDTNDFIYQLVTQRYLPLVRNVNLAFNNSHYDQLDHLFKATDWSHKRQMYKSHLRQGSMKVISIFLQIPSKSVIKICVGNYIEHLIHRAVGLEYVCPFLSVFAGISKEFILKSH